MTPIHSETTARDLDRYPQARVLIIDDDRDFVSVLMELLADRYQLAVAYSGKAGLDQIPILNPDVVLLDISLEPELDGFHVLEHIKSSGLPIAVVMLTKAGDIDSVVRSVRGGAFHYVQKPPQIHELANVVNRAFADTFMKRRMQTLRDDIRRLKGDMVVEDATMLKVLADIEKVAPTKATVLINGESGTGKEMVARRIHEMSRRADCPFVAMNCSAIPDNLIESEIFGHVKGAFTGASQDRLGKLELAHGGTLFLDEIGYASLELQKKLLRVIEDRECIPVGTSKSHLVDVRFLAATSNNLEDMIASGNFLEELFFRLNVYRLTLPPLRERPGDIQALADHFLARIVPDLGRTVKGFSAEAREYLEAQTWRGNIRGLRNAVERAAIDCTGEWIRPEHLAPSLRNWPTSLAPYDQAKSKELTRFRRDYLLELMRRCDGDIETAVKMSRISRNGLLRMLREEGLK